MARNCLLRPIKQRAFKLLERARLEHQQKDVARFRGANIDNRQLYRYFLPSFRAAIEAGATTVMVNSGSINGIPVHSSRELLTGLLREQLGFNGMVVTDYQDIEKLTYFHHVAATYEEGIQMALGAGIDMSMVPLDYSFPVILEQLVQSGKISEGVVNNAAGRILQLKENVGLFAKPYGDPNDPRLPSVGSAADRLASLEIARQTITLLKNDNNLLPLPNTTITKILVVGPCAHSPSCQSGGWSIHWQGGQDWEFPYGVSLYQGLALVLRRSKNVVVDLKYVQGSTYTALTDAAQAVEEAKTASVVILAVGEPPEAEIPGDINDLALYQAQQELYLMLANATRAPIITVMMAARPRLFGALANSSALLMAYLPGPDGGQAIAEVLFGTVNPSGRLPITYPQFSGDISVPYYHLYSATTSPLYPFGHGLSYTSFSYSNLQLNTTTPKVGEAVQAQVTVTNTGKVEGRETTLLYLSDSYASVCPEVKMLKGFARASIFPGKSVTHTFVLPAEAFSFIGRDNQPTIEPGEFVVQVANLSAVINMA